MCQVVHRFSHGPETLPCIYAPEQVLIGSQQILYNENRNLDLGDAISLHPAICIVFDYLLIFLITK